MVLKTCSTKKVIAQFYRKFKPTNSGFVEDAIEWIADAVEIMGVNQGYRETFIDLDVVDFRVKLPCSVEGIQAITYNGLRLNREGGIMHRHNMSHLCTSAFGTNSYKLNPNYIETSFQEGCIRVFYYGLEVDCDSYPFVVDDALYRDALMWYILKEMIGRGFVQTGFSYDIAEARWEKAYPKAQNRCKMPDIDRMENFKINFLGVVKNLNRANEFFRTNGGSYVDSANTPGSLLQTYQYIGTEE